ncbi:MAG: 8-amino-7-oxononanoate synthase [Frankiaceae bacterium]|jgi:8-amino-7-oxononanoate synthase|nr:8-amino-7-oxononanoate synthase [Frankiaceae bacterium]
MTAYDAWLRKAADERDRDGLTRRLHPRERNSQLVDVAGNDYLGLARDPRVVAAAADAARTWGAGSTGSRLVTGTTELHTAFEIELAAFMNADAALLFSSGYCANLAVLQALADDDTLVVSDAGNHASLIDGCRLARAHTTVVPHADPEAVARALSNRTQTRAIVVTDSVFSVDGDLAPVAELHAAARTYDALLVVDEAHALGVVGAGGRGLVHGAGLAGEADIVRTVTLSKSLGSQGGAVLASRAVVDHLVNTGRSFIFDTGLAPACVGAARRALQILDASPQLADDVRRHARRIAAELGVAPPDAAILSVVLGDPQRALAAAERCRDAGVAVGCFRPPSVPAGTDRLRVTARADLTDDDIARVVETVAAAAKEQA